MKKILPLLLIAAIFVSFSLSGCATVPKGRAYLEAIQEGMKARKALDAGDYKTCDVACKKGLEILGPEDDLIRMYFLTMSTDSKNQQGDYPSAIKFADMAMPLVSRYYGRTSKEYVFLVHLKASAYFYQLNFAKAEPLYYEAETIFDRLKASERKDGALAHRYDQTLSGLFVCLTANGNDAEARAVCKRLSYDMGDAAEDDMSDFSFNMLLAEVLALEGDVLYEKHKYALAKPFFEKSIRVFKQWMYRGPQLKKQKVVYVPTNAIVTGMAHLGDIYQKQGKVAAGKLLKHEARSWGFVGDRVDLQKRPDPDEWED